MTLILGRMTLILGGMTHCFVEGDTCDNNEENSVTPPSTKEMTFVLSRGIHVTMKKTVSFVLSRGYM